MGFETRDYSRGDDRPNIRISLPQVSPLFWAIAGTCLILFVLQSATRGSSSFPITDWGSLDLEAGRAFRQPWRWITYQYLHGDAGHLFFNMLGLYFFLPWMESRWGWQKTFTFYTLGGIASGIAYAVLALLGPRFAGSGLIGASGSIFAILGACALFFPDRRIIVIFIPMTVRALAALYGVYFLLSSLADRDASNTAHLGGLLFGFLAPYFAGPKLDDLRSAYVSRQKSRKQNVEVATEAEIDRILAKVSANGMHTLTRGEQKTLKQASERKRR